MEHGDTVPNKNKEKTQSKITRVKATRQIQKTVKILMVLIILKLGKPLMIQMTPNESLHNVG